MNPSSMEQGALRKVSPHTWLAALFGLLFIVTAVVPDWLELLGFDHLDHGNGSAEGIVLLILGVVAVVEGAAALVALRRRSLVAQPAAKHT